MSKFVGLIILDGYGLNRSKLGNAVKLANPTNIDHYFKNYPYTTLKASGEAVGLPKGQMGNSEVGHLNIGAGKVVMQSLLKINVSIEKKEFFNNKALLSVIKHVKKTGGALHLMGLTSSGGVHSHISHLYALIELAKQHDLKKVYIHAFTDGRDTLRDSAILELKKLKSKLRGTKYEIATVIGRFYAMDRESNFDRTQKAYNAIVLGQADIYEKDIEKALKNSYDKGVYDEFLEPVVVAENKESAKKLSSNDGIIFFNYREDRARQLTKALVEKGFKHFARPKLKNIKMATFTRYDKDFKQPVIAFEKDYLNENLSQVVSKAGLKQFKITETTKYAHVTYFLNGGLETPYKNEDRFLIETLKVARFDEYPQMRAVEITNKAIEEIRSQKYNLMVLNYSNPDMIGHTGNLKAAIKAIKLLNKEVKRLVEEILKIDGIAILTADHGNAEEMLDKKGNVLTDHTTNEVPFAIVGKNVSNITLESGGVLGNIAPTILDLLGVKAPKSFECKSLIIHNK